jgi:hypothetical protein
LESEAKKRQKTEDSNAQFGVKNNSVGQGLNQRNDGGTEKLNIE